MRNVITRALLGVLSLFFLIPAIVAVGGAYLPDVATIGPFGTVLNTGLAYVLVAAAAAMICAGAAVVIGGRKVNVLFALSLATFLGAAAVGMRFANVATAHGASYDLIRSIEGFPPLPEPDQEVIFATVDGEDLQADLWVPEAATTAEPRTQRAVVFVHGGSFIAGTTGTRPLLTGALRDAGIVAVDVEYRLAPPPRWDEAPADILCALAWLRTAPELAAVDPAKVVLVGESAGGSLALVAGFAAGTDAIAPSCTTPRAPIVPAGVVALAPAADLAGIWADATIYDNEGKRFPEAYVGGSPSEYPERYEAASPFRLFRRDMPPALIIAAENDRMVRLERVLSIVDGIRDVDGDVELIVAPFTGHGFDGEPNSFGDQLTEAVVPRFVLDVTS
jgi:acetyl esterase/lipase